MQQMVVGLFLLSLFQFFASSPQHWAQTAKETIWREKYTNCDKGYSVSLPKGLLAHGELPPSSNHGFLVSAKAPDTVAEVTLETQRLVGVYDSYDAMGYGSARSYLKAELAHAGPVDILEIRDIKFRGLPTASVRYREGVGAGAVEAAEIIIFRGHPENSGPIFYVIWLRTPSAHYEEDRRLYKLICDGFRILPVPSGECSND